MNVGQTFYKQLLRTMEDNRRKARLMLAKCVLCEYETFNVYEFIMQHTAYLNMLYGVDLSKGGLIARGFKHSNTRVLMWLWHVYSPILARAKEQSPNELNPPQTKPNRP
ncbi:hypothetical protein V6Z12_A10G214700 [Gossypium hirsutum]